ncbi:MAG TPA: ParB/RepB/Spo0J family partition protein [bacterium]|nr:ParB/RepB/Spo0J family partition protein [bacterium]
MPTLSPVAQVVEIPLANVHPNPKNPGPPIPADQITDLAENIEAEGLLNPIKVMPLVRSPQAEKSPHGPGAPDPRNQQWVILAGERRYWAFLWLKRETIPAFLLDPTPAEAVKITHLDNAVRERGWWADYQSIEALKQADPTLRQREIGAGLKIDLPKVNRALSLLPLLNPEARAILVSDTNNGNKGNKGISELAAAELAGLATDPVTPATQALVQRALVEVRDQNLTQMGVREMVQWIHQGKKPEDYRPGMAKAGGNKPSPRPSRPAVKAGVSDQAVEAPQDPAPAPGSKGNPVPVSGGKTDLQVLYDHLKGNGLLAGGLIGALGGFLASNLKRALGTFVRRYMLHALAALGILALLVFHGVGNLFHKSPNTQETTSAVPAERPERPEGVERAQVPAQAEASNVVPAKPIPNKPEPKQMGRQAPLGSAAKRAAGGQPQVVQPSAQPVPGWAPEGIPLLKEFGDHFYGRSGSMWSDDLAYFKGLLTADYYPTFQKQFFPSAQQTEMQTKQEYQLYSKGQAPRATGGAGNTVLYRIQGQVTLQSRASRVPKTLWTKPMALEISLRHLEGLGYRVERVREVQPRQEAGSATAGSAGNGVDPLKAVQDVSGGVANVAGDVEKVDAAKKALGL